mgnify:CR=1 FL=1
MPRILLIDDDAGLGEPLAAYFARFGLQVEQATRPSAGLALLRRGYGARELGLLWSGNFIRLLRRAPDFHKKPTVFLFLAQ